MITPAKAGLCPSPRVLTMYSTNSLGMQAARGGASSPIARRSSCPASVHAASKDAATHCGQYASPH
jgi:hypothetical protein